MPKKYQKIYQYTVVFEPDEESGGYIVSVPALPGCVTEGDTFAQAVEMAKDAILAYMGSLRKHNEPIPAESPKTVIKKINIELSEKTLERK